MKFPANLLDLLVEHDAFRVCRIMPDEEFVRFCKDREFSVDFDRLRQFERIEVFRPMLRAYHPEVTFKIGMLDGCSRYLGELEEGEAWTGETRTEIVAFDPTTATAARWRDDGLLWVPGQGEWVHEATIDTEPERHTAYYSRFQIWALGWVTSMLTLSVQLEWATAADGSPNPKWSPQLRKRAGDYGRKAAAALRGYGDQDATAAFCQLIANRFYYKTQSDGRRMTIGQFHDWEWGQYARAWTPDAFLAAFELSEEDSRNLFEQLDIAWTHEDPISGWYNLARFVSVEKRKRLKNHALRALTLREMTHMLRLFHEAAFGQSLRPLGEVGVHVIKRIPDVDAEADPMRALELSANDFGVNGKPQLVLFVEGATEQAVLPILFQRLYGTPPARYGIEISSLGGVDNAAGGREAPFSALWRLVDYLHYHQTLAFVLLDNEGNARRNVGKGLARAASVHVPDRRATRRDHIKIWRTSFELENFSDTEIAAAMNSVAGAALFHRADLAACRTAASAGRIKGQKLETIDRLFERTTKRSLDKPGLAKVLVELMFDPATRRRPENRPISKFLIRVAKKSARNFQPITEESWLANQRSGYLGVLQPAARRDRKRRQASRRRKIAKAKRGQPG